MNQFRKSNQAGLNSSREMSDWLGKAPGENPMRILLVDDDPEFLQLASAYLAELQHAVDTASSLGEVVGRLGGSVRYDTVICDVHLQPNHGSEVFRLAKEKLTDFPLFLFVTSLPEKDTVMGLIRSGADYILCKPLTVDHLRLGLEKAEARKQEREFQAILRSAK